MSKYVRLKRRDPKHGIVLRQFVYLGVRFLETGGWYVVADEVAAYLKEHARQSATDPRSPEAFDICTEAEARSIDEQENVEAKPRRPADNARMTTPRGITTKNLRPVKKKGRPRKKKTEKAQTQTDVDKGGNETSSETENENSPEEKEEQ